MYIVLCGVVVLWCCIFHFVPKMKISAYWIFVDMIFVIFALVISVSSKCVNSEYNYYELAVQNWCHDGYYLHGLWPQVNNSYYPQWCPGTGYREIPDGHQLNQMNRWWYYCQQAAQSFWAHEWDKHGTCVEIATGINQTTYFNIAIDLFKSVYNESKTWKCGYSDDCVVACFDLNFNRLEC